MCYVNNKQANTTSSRASSHQRLSFTFTSASRDRHHNINVTNCLTNFVWIELKNVDINMAISDHHRDTFKRVFGAFPTFPSHSRLFSIFIKHYYTIQVGFAAIFEPPTTSLFLCTVFVTFVVVPVSGAELHTDMVGQRVTFQQRTTRKRNFISQIAHMRINSTFVRICNRPNSSLLPKFWHRKIRQLSF